MTARPAGPALEEGAGGADWAWRFVEAKWAKRSCSFFKVIKRFNFFCWSARTVRLTIKVSFGSQGMAQSISIPAARTPQLAHSYPDVALESRVSTWSGRGCKTGGLPQCLLDGMVKNGLKENIVFDIVVSNLLTSLLVVNILWSNLLERLGSRHSGKNAIISKATIHQWRRPTTTHRWRRPTITASGTIFRRLLLRGLGHYLGWTWLKLGILWVLSYEVLESTHWQLVSWSSKVVKLFVSYMFQFRALQDSQRFPQRGQKFPLPQGGLPPCLLPLLPPRPHTQASPHQPHHHPWQALNLGPVWASVERQMESFEKILYKEGSRILHILHKRYWWI